MTTSHALFPTGAVGVVVGKFNPPHLGHLHLIETAAAHVGRLYVLLCDRTDQTLPASDRQAWLQAASPVNVTVLVTPDDLPEDNDAWARRALEVLPERPDVAFTSEEWGPGWAEAMGVSHGSVDTARTTVPISGTRLRGNLTDHFPFLVEPARVALARRVTLIGAESTGKTTLADALARHYETVWVPEHGRWYWEGRRHLRDQAWCSDEFHRIAHAQRQLTRDLTLRAPNGLVISDTDTLVTASWHARYVGTRDAVLDAAAHTDAPDLYLLCAADFGWIQDGTRESEQHRDRMQADLAALATATGTPVVDVTGDIDARLATAVTHIDPLLRRPQLI